MTAVAIEYVITPSIALYGSMPPSILNTHQQSLAFACHAFLARAAYHGATLHVPMLFYSQIVEAVYATYTQDYLEFDDCKTLARTILSTNWEYTIPDTDTILEMQQTLNHPPQSGDAEYLSVAAQRNCAIVTTAAHLLASSSGQTIVLIQTHPWAGAGALEEFPPSQ